MIIRMLASGCVEELIDEVALRFIADGRAEKYPPTPVVEVPLTPQEMAILHAEEVAGPAGTAGIEVALATPKVERAVLSYFRTMRSPRRARA
jgi:hypothetical protein